MDLGPKFWLHVVRKIGRKKSREYFAKLKCEFIAKTAVNTVVNTAVNTAVNAA